MLRRSFVAGIAMMAAGFVGLGTALAAPKTYKYKCPNDGQTMVRQN